MSTLITGALGFTGSHLVTCIAEKTLRVTRPLKDSGGIEDVIECDLLDSAKVNKLIEKHRPHRIYHLAGSFTQNYETDFVGNVRTTKNILSAVKEFSPTTRVLLVGSAAEYGVLTYSDCPISEDTVTRPFNNYGLTKIYQKSLMDYYVNAFSLDIVMVRPFNLYGKGISPLLFIGKVYEQIAALKNCEITEISLGNLDSQRDYICIEDAVKHYMTVMKKGSTGEVYNVATGEPTRTRDLLRNILVDEGFDLSVVKSNTRTAQANDSDMIFADITKLKALYND